MPERVHGYLSIRAQHYLGRQALVVEREDGEFVLRQRTGETLLGDEEQDADYALRALIANREEYTGGSGTPCRASG
jgi:hypothetical protein